MHLDLNAHEGPEDFALPVEVRVKQGMALLDEKHGPEWVWRIDVDTLDLAHPCRCVLGQLHGSYGVGAKAELGDGWSVGTRRCGFFAEHSPYEDVWWQDWDALTTAWRHAILTRRLELGQ